MNNTQTQPPARSKIDMLRDQRALARDLDDPLMQADLDDEPEPEPEPAPAPKPEPVPEPVAAKPVSKSKPAPIKRPGKSLTRPAVLAALERCQPATKEVLRLQLESEGYPVSDKAGMGRIRNHLYNMRYAGKAKQLAADLWALPSYSDPNKTPAPTPKPEPEPAPKQEPVAAATPEPEPKHEPEPITPELPKLPPALVQCHIIEANFETADGETVSVYVASGGRVVLTPIGSHAVSFSSMDEFRAFVARVHRLRSFLDDPQ